MAGRRGAHKWTRALGHSDLSTTADVYAHPTDRVAADAATRVDVILAKRAAG